LKIASKNSSIDITIKLSKIKSKAYTYMLADKRCNAMLNEDENLPKYVQIAEYFKALIKSQDLAYGEKLLSESEIVEKFKVSRHTVRQALMNLEKDGYIYKEQGRGAFCSYEERKNQSKNIAVLTTYISNYIFPPIISGIEEVLSASGYTLTLFNTNNEKQKEGEYLNKIIESDAVGLIVEPTMSALENINLNWYENLEKRKLPYIMINAKYDSLNPAYVVMDDAEGGYILTKYLIQMGHRNIAGIFKYDDLQGVNRQSGYLKALLEYGVNVQDEYICKYGTQEREFLPYEFTSNLLRKSNRPTAVVCYNDQIAFYVLQAIHDAGLKVPEDISIVGYDDSDIATATEVKLTTIKHPKHEMGKRAARFLINMIENMEEKPYYVYRPELIVRNSATSFMDISSNNLK
jgi:GntR family transcriptional regulator, arabinose operon transcriptional repressor